MDGFSYTKKEKAMLNTALNKVKKCDGNCKNCEKSHIYIAKNALCYAFGCDVLPEKYFDTISDSLTELHDKAIEVLTFELSLPTIG